MQYIEANGIKWHILKTYKTPVSAKKDPLCALVYVADIVTRTDRAGIWAMMYIKEC
jgi:hypothetical protein